MLASGAIGRESHGADGSSGLGRPDGLILALLVACGAVLYRPWVDLPQPVTDMPVILSILQRAPNVWSGTGDLIAHYADEARFTPGSMAALAVFHGLFGDAGTDWRWARFALCALVTAGAYLVYRRANLGRLGAAAGASLFVIADPARPGWLMPQVMEPLALGFLLIALAVALGFRSSASQWRSALAIGMSLVAAIWVKEPMVAAVPFVVLVALTWSDGTWSVPTRTTMYVRPLIIGVAGLTLLFNVLPLAYIRLAHDSPNYASRYSLEGLSWSAWSNSFRASALPVTRVASFPANVAAVALVFGGIAFSGSERRRSHLILLGIAAVLPLAVSLLYAPWPSFTGYYALPALLGLGLIIGASVDRFTVRSRLSRHLAVLLVVVVVGFGSLMAVNSFEQYRAQRHLDLTLARALAAPVDSSSLVVGTRDPSRSGALGRSLVRYTHLFADPSAIRDAVDVSCERAAVTARSPSADTVVVAFLEDCPQIARTGDVVRMHYTRWDWKTLRPQRDSVAAMIFRRSGV